LDAVLAGYLITRYRSDFMAPEAVQPPAQRLMDHPFDVTRAQAFPQQD
jgi:hypothetical protein